MIGVKSWRLLQFLLRNIKDIIIVFHIVCERTEWNCKQLFTHAEKPSKCYDSIGNLSGTGIYDDFLNVAEIFAIRINNIRSDYA